MSHWSKSKKSTAPEAGAFDPEINKKTAAAKKGSTKTKSVKSSSRYDLLPDQFSPPGSAKPRTGNAAAQGSAKKKVTSTLSHLFSKSKTGSSANASPRPQTSGGREHQREAPQDERGPPYVQDAWKSMNEGSGSPARRGSHERRGGAYSGQDPGRHSYTRPTVMELENGTQDYGSEVVDATRRDDQYAAETRRQLLQTVHGNSTVSEHHGAIQRKSSADTRQKSGSRSKKGCMPRCTSSQSPGFPDGGGTYMYAPTNDNTSRQNSMNRQLQQGSQTNPVNENFTGSDSSSRSSYIQGSADRSRSSHGSTSEHRSARGDAQKASATSKASSTYQVPRSTSGSQLQENAYRRTPSGSSERHGYGSSPGSQSLYEPTRQQIVRNGSSGRYGNTQSHTSHQQTSDSLHQHIPNEPYVPSSGAGRRPQTPSRLELGQKRPSPENSVVDREKIPRKEEQPHKECKASSSSRSATARQKHPSGGTSQRVESSGVQTRSQAPDVPGQSHTSEHQRSPMQQGRVDALENYNLKSRSTAQAEAPEEVQASVWETKKQEDDLSDFNLRAGKRASAKAGMSEEYQASMWESNSNRQDGSVKSIKGTAPATAKFTASARQEDADFNQRAAKATGRSPVDEYQATGYSDVHEGYRKVESRRDTTSDSRYSKSKRGTDPTPSSSRSDRSGRRSDPKSLDKRGQEDEHTDWNNFNQMSASGYSAKTTPERRAEARDTLRSPEGDILDRSTREGTTRSAAQERRPRSRDVLASSQAEDDFSNVNERSVRKSTTASRAHPRGPASTPAAPEEEEDLDNYNLRSTDKKRTTERTFQASRDRDVHATTVSSTFKSEAERPRDKPNKKATPDDSMDDLEDDFNLRYAGKKAADKKTEEDLEYQEEQWAEDDPSGKEHLTRTTKAEADPYLIEDFENEASRRVKQRLAEAERDPRLLGENAMRDKPAKWYESQDSMRGASKGGGGGNKRHNESITELFKECLVEVSIYPGISGSHLRRLLEAKIDGRLKKGRNPPGKLSRGQLTDLKDDLGNYSNHDLEVLVDGLFIDKEVNMITYKMMKNMLREEE